MKKALSLLTAAGMAITATAQQVRPAGSQTIYHELGQLRHLTKVLYVAAHPDDENTRLLAWLVNEKNIRTAYLSLTRGDGGQNILGSEQGEALGLIRTHELMEARKIDGAEQYFSRAVDFGFSKNFDETFNHWEKDSLVADAVWVMRTFRPDVVICRFPPNKDAGHGQHAASAIIAAEAFKASGNSSKYPNQLAYTQAWSPKRILWNTYKFGDRNTTAEDQLKIKVGDYLPTMGMGTGELAGISRSIHRSQGAGTPGVPGMQTEYFKFVDGEPAQNSLFDGIDITWGRIGRNDIGDDIKAIMNSFDFRHPDAALPALLDLRKKIKQLPDPYWKKEKLAELDQIILDCSGLMAEYFTKQPQSTNDATLQATLQVIARSQTTVQLLGITWLSNATTNSSDTLTTVNAGNDTLFKADHWLKLNKANTVQTEPYWLSKHHQQPSLFSVSDLNLLGRPETPVEQYALLHLKIGGQQFKVEVPLSYKKLDPVKGDVVEQLRIVPGATLSFNNSLLIVNKDGSLDADVKIHTNRAIKNASLSINKGTFSIAALRGIDINANTDTVLPVHIAASRMKEVADDQFYLFPSLSTDDNIYDDQLHLIQYSHIPTLQYFTPVYAKVLKPDWKCLAKRIGVIEGAGDFTAGFLKLAGLNVDVLKESDMADFARLQRYEAIITGIRAVNVEKRMAVWMPALLKYVEKGGTLVMQYNTTQDLATQKLGPYPFTLASDKRVTEEDAAITFTDAKNRLLNFPNKITDNDFKGWVQERGLYFAAKWDGQYKTLFSMHDAGEEALTGGTLYTPYGKGQYIYTSLSFSRQLPAGNTGAIRLLMNFLSAGK